MHLQTTRFVWTLWLALAACLSGCSNDATAVAEQEASVRAFYGQILKYREGGVPSREVIDQLAPLISSRFKDRLLAAQEAETRHRRKTGNQEPPLVEGALFFSLAEGAHRLQAVTQAKDSAPPSFLVALEYGDAQDPKQRVQWNDLAILVQEGGRWVVDDLTLLGDWQFGTKGRLSDFLSAVVSQAPK